MQDYCQLEINEKSREMSTGMGKVGYCRGLPQQGLSQAQKIPSHKYVIKNFSIIALFQLNKMLFCCVPCYIHLMGHRPQDLVSTMLIRASKYRVYSNSTLGHTSFHSFIKLFRKDPLY